MSTTTLTKAIAVASKCWCGAQFGRNRMCSRVDQHDALKLLQSVRAQCNCVARHDLAKICAERRDKPLKSWCRCICHGKEIRDVLAIEAEANSRQRCFLVDVETDEQCTRNPGHRGGCVAATGRTLGQTQHVDAAARAQHTQTPTTTNNS